MHINRARKYRLQILSALSQKFFFREHRFGGNDGTNMAPRQILELLLAHFAKVIYFLHHKIVVRPQFSGKCGLIRLGNDRRINRD